MTVSVLGNTENMLTNTQVFPNSITFEQVVNNLRDQGVM